MSASMSDNARMLEAISDGRRWSTGELLNLHLTPHSRKSDLEHRYGYGIAVTRESSGHGEKAIYFYRLLTVPPEPTPLEQVIDPDAAARLSSLRAAQTPRDVVTGFPPPSPLAGGGQHAPTAAGSPPLAEMLAELRAIDDEIVSIRDRVSLGIEDSALLDTLLQARKELDAAVRDLEERAA